MCSNCTSRLSIFCANDAKTVYVSRSGVSITIFCKSQTADRPRDPLMIGCSRAAFPGDFFGRKENGKRDEQTATIVSKNDRSDVIHLARTTSRSTRDILYDLSCYLTTGFSS